MRSARKMKVLLSILFITVSYLAVICCAIADKTNSAADYVAQKVAAQPAARTLKPADITIPKEYGRIKEVFDAGGDKLVIHMQDAHTNYEAQKNAANILEDLIKRYGLYLILVEGGSRDVSLNKYRENATLEERKKTAEESLKNGVIAGEEYLNIASDYPMKLQGIEDRSVYDKNMEAFLGADKYKSEALNFTGALNGLANALKSKIYSKPLKDFDDKRAAFKKQAIKLNEYINYLNAMAKSKKQDLSAYQNYDRLCNSVELEKTIDFAAVETERATVIDALSKKIDKDALNELLVNSAAFKSGKLTQAQYHNYLKGLIEKSKLRLAQYPNLDKYIKYIVGYEKIDSAELFGEIKMVEDKIEQSLTTSEDQRQLALIAKDLDMLEQFINLKLGPDDYEYYKKNESNFDTSAWARFLNAQAIKHGLAQKVPEDAQVITNITPHLKDFYTNARKRDYIFLANTKKYMDEEKVNIAVLIAGGFHTPSLMKLFRENNISYVVVGPKVLKPTDEKLYHKILTEGWAPAGQGTEPQEGNPEDLIVSGEEE